MTKKREQIWGFNKEKLQRLFLYWLVVGVSFIVLIFLVTSTLIGMEVRERCLAAKAKYSGDCVDALTQTLDDSENSLRERNYAIWTLGQVGDDRAKPTIEQYYTGDIPEREPYDEVLSQYEMKKALQLLDGDFNVTHLVTGSRNF